jgi:hypothetical protein
VTSDQRPLSAAEIGRACQDAVESVNPHLNAKASVVIVGPSVSGDHMPDATAHRIMSTVNVKYRAALQTLVYPGSCLAAQVPVGDGRNEARRGGGHSQPSGR